MFLPLGQPQFADFEVRACHFIRMLLYQIERTGRADETPEHPLNPFLQKFNNAMDIIILNNWYSAMHIKAQITEFWQSPE